MAKRINYTYQPHKMVGSDMKPSCAAIVGVPALLWANGEVWIEATSYLAMRAASKRANGNSIEAVSAESWHLRAYAEFLEANPNLSWCDFPDEPSSRPTYLFRGHVLKARRAREISPATATARMSSVSRFYSWAMRSGLLAEDAVPLVPRDTSIRYYNRVGLSQTTRVTTSDLAIPNRSVKSPGVEDGLFPLTTPQRDFMVRAIHGELHVEFELMLLLGFFSGMRIGTIVSLTRTALEHAVSSREITGWISIEVGAGTNIPAKGDVHYFPSMPPWLASELRNYYESMRAAQRRAKASAADQDLIFLKRNGGRYTNTTAREQMAKLRRLIRAGDSGIYDFKFHCTRATFGTSVLMAFLKHSSLSTEQILSKLMRLMGHRSIQSTLRYLKFVEESSQDQEINNSYAALLLGHHAQ